MKSSSYSQNIAETYAGALMSLAKQQDLAETFGNDVQIILNSLAASDDLTRLLSIPIVKDAVKKDAIQRVFGEQIHPYVLNFLKLLVDKKRIVLLKSVCVQFQALLRDLNQIALAEVISAVPLSDVQRETLRQQAQQLAKSLAVELVVEVDPELIGGVIIKIGSQVVDASIRGQLRRIASSLTAA